ncbi:MAG: glycine-rich domain-containing protein-like [Sulfobacillus sp.]
MNLNLKLNLAKLAFEPEHAPIAKCNTASAGTGGLAFSLDILKKSAIEHLELLREACGNYPDAVALRQAEPRYLDLMTEFQERNTVEVRGPLDGDTLCLPSLYQLVRAPAEGIPSFRNEPFEVRWSLHLHMLHPQSFHHDLQRTAPRFSPSIDLPSLSARQSRFTELICKTFPGKCDLSDNVLGGAYSDYLRFLSLLRDHGIRLSPSLLIDFVWRTHMRHPGTYYHDTQATCGWLVDHSDD